jgi:ribonuclease Z
MKKLMVMSALIAALVAVAYSKRAAIAEQLLTHALPPRMSTNTLAALEDGLHVMLCGAGGPMPAPNASGPCVMVIAGRQAFVVDAGTDGARNISRMGFQLGDINAVFITHFHSDHIDGLGELATLRWAAGNSDTPLPVYGPRGVERVVNGFNDAYGQDFAYRHEHHGDTVAPLSAAGLSAEPFEPPLVGELAPVYAHNEVTVEALLVDHAPVTPAVGYKFSYGGRTVLISGDTAQSANITALADKVDLLVHEALAPNLLSMMNVAAEQAGNANLAKIAIDVLDYHASPKQAAETARDANVGHLLYYHVVPPLILPGQEALWLDGAEDIFSRYTVGRDGTSFSLPAHSAAVIESQRL